MTSAVYKLVLGAGIVDTQEERPKRLLEESEKSEDKNEHGRGKEEVVYKDRSTIETIFNNSIGKSMRENDF